MERPSSPEPGKRWGLRRPWRLRPRRLRTIALLPTLITLGNGVCGVVAILQIGQGLETGDVRFFYRAAWLILAAMIFDALDGFVARMTNTSSNFGAQLDSLCDLVTFGVAPAFLVFAMSRTRLAPEPPWDRFFQAVCVLYAMCALVRLARFTVETAPDESSHREFAGLPSPAAAGVLAAAVLPSQALRKLGGIGPEILDGIGGALPGLAFGLGILMVSRIKYVHVVNRLLRGKRSFVTLVELMLVAALLFLFREFAIFLAFFGYAAMGPMLWLKGRFSRKTAVAAGAPPTTQPERDKTLF